MGNLGEVFDTILLLKFRTLDCQHLHLLIQSFLVCAFAATTMFSGPIVRWSTRMGSVQFYIEAPVYPAMKEFDIIACANTYWTDIDRSLTYANFPYDRLLDFLPDTSIN